MSRYRSKAWRWWVVVGTVVGVLAGLTPLAGTETAAASEVNRSSFVGASTHTFWLSESDVAAELGALADGGVRWAREDFRWDLLEPTKGTFDWRRGDAIMAGAARAGVEVLAILTYSAKWASSDPSGAGNIFYPPTRVEDYAAYARSVVERYGPGGAFWHSRPDLTPRPLTAVELWNEPWGHWFWKSGVDPVAYARLARAGAEAVKAGNPQVEVLLAGDLLQVRTDGALRPWLDEVLTADPGLIPLIDAYSVHPYPYARELGPLVERSDRRWDFGRIELINEVAERRNAAKPIWLTELGWSTADTSDSVTEAEQATFLHDAVIKAATWPYVERIFLYTWTKDRPDRSDRESSYGFRRPDGTFKPAWAAVGEAVRAVAATSALPAEPPQLTCAEPAAFVRLAGRDRIETAIAVSAADFRDRAASGVVLAQSADFPDALSGVPLAVEVGGPLLLTPSSRLDARTAIELRRVLPAGGTVHVLGGPAALSHDVETAVRAMGFEAVRIGGRNRFETATLIAEQGLGSPDTVLLARGDDFPDALSAGAAAPAVQGAVLLTAGDAVPPETAQYLLARSPSRRYSVGAAAARALPSAVPLVGHDRYDTARIVAAALLEAPTSVSLANGEGFADALAGGVHSARRGGHLLLTRATSAPPPVGAHLSALSSVERFVYGGPTAVADAVGACA